jgi:hypothetical protein
VWSRKRTFGEAVILDTGYTAFKRHGVTVVRLETKAESGRHRRLAPDGEESCSHIRALIFAR